MNTDALARELANSCAEDIAAETGYMNFKPFSKCIMRRTKLRELCACAEALRGMVEWYGGMANSADMEEGATQAVRSAEEALAALDGG